MDTLIMALVTTVTLITTLIIMVVDITVATDTGTNQLNRIQRKQGCSFGQPCSILMMPAGLNKYQISLKVVDLGTDRSSADNFVQRSHTLRLSIPLFTKFFSFHFLSEIL
jgi:hypothetical protein